MHFFSTYWMLEPYLGSMQTESLAFGAVEFVTNDGIAESVGVCTMDAQLVGASRLWP